MDSFLGIDLGTSSVKVMLIDRSGLVRATRSRGYPIYQPQPGYAEQSPEGWWEATRLCISDLVTGGEIKRGELKSIGLSGQMHGLVLLDAGGNALGNAIIWPDRRTTQICAEWAASTRAQTFHNVTGMPLATGFLAPSLEWVKRHEPERYRQAARFILPKDYIRLRLTGQIATDPSDACGTYLFDIRSRDWSRDTLHAFQLNESLLPPVVETLSVAGTITPEAATQTGLAQGTPVIAGGSDQAMAALGLGADQPGKVAVALSTGGTVITTVMSPLHDPRMHTLCHAYKDRWLMMGAMMSAGSSMSWLKDNVLLSTTMEELAGWAEDVPAGSNGLFFLPYLSGERTPHMNPNAKGCFIGLTLSHTRAHMARSIMEGVMYSLHNSVEILQELGLPVDEVLCYGGGSKSQAWRQIMADVFAFPVQWRLFSDYSALGAAAAAALASGADISLENSYESSTESLLPRSESSRVYLARRSTFKRMYDQLKGIFEELSEFPAS